MAMKINPPTYAKSSKDYERYKQELLAWNEITDVDPKKRGIAIALTLPDGDSSRIREKVFDEIHLADLKRDNGLDILINFLDKHLGKDDLEDSLTKFEEFEDYVRQPDESIETYISNFDRKYHRILKKAMRLPSEILAFKLLRKARITREEKMLVMTGMDYSEKETLYEQASKSLKKFKGSNGPSGCVTSSQSIKLEPAVLMANEEALLSAGYIHKSKVNRNYQRGRQGQGLKSYASGQRCYQSFQQVGNGKQDWRGSGTSRRARNINPNGYDGQPLTCTACGSFRHFLKDCPDSWENLSKVNIAEESEPVENVVLFTGQLKQQVSQLGFEAQNSAVLDSACSSTVCGHTWLSNYIDSLSENERDQVKRVDSTRIFKFGGGTRLHSDGEYSLPATIVGKKVVIKTDVVKSDVPLLLSKSAMKTAKVKLNLEDDSAEILGKEVVLNCTSSGHYCVPLVEELPVCAVELDKMSLPERNKTLLKLHKQFAHPGSKRLIALLKDAGVWKPDYAECIEDMTAKCIICKQHQATPSRPVVAMPMANHFNEKVAMDLKKWENGYILHMIDMWSRYSVSVYISHKRPQVIIDKLMQHWIGIFGVMRGLLFDNGGEFNSEESREVASILDIHVSTTAADSPFQNGLCERVHGIIDMMLLKLQCEYPKASVQTLLCWANMARNSLQMNNGFSSNQLVFGTNPNLPNILQENPPALEGTTSSESFAHHLNILHAARQAFIQSESSERIRRALRHKVRASGQIFRHGDIVYYKRENRERWLGPAKVIFQDGKVVFVRHGGVFVRVSPNRLTKAEQDYQGSIMNGEQTGESGQEPCKESERFVVNEELGEGIEHLSGGSERDTNQESETAIPDRGMEEPGSRTEGPEPKMAVDVPRKGDMIEFRMDDDSEWVRATILGRAGKVSGKYHNRYNVREEESKEEKSLDLKKVLYRKTDDLEEINVVMIPVNRHEEEECLKAKEAELTKLSSFDTYEEVEDEGQHRISCRWVIGTKGNKVRARLVARGFEDIDIYRRDSPTVAKSTLRTVLSIAASKDWVVKTTDIKSAFLQGKEIERNVFLQPPKEAKIRDGKIWKLKRCLYGLNDAARQFYQSVKETMIALGCTQSDLDSALFSKKSKEGYLEGFMVCHIDDFLHAGKSCFDVEVMARLRSRFVAGKLEEGRFTYVGFEIIQTQRGITLDQSEYVREIEVAVVPTGRAVDKTRELNKKEKTSLRACVGRLNWAVQGTRPDMAFDMIDLSTKFKKGRIEDLMLAVKSLRRLQEGNSFVIFPAMKLEEASLIIFTDAAHANLNDGLSSTAARVVFLVDKSGRCSTLAWHANKIKRVVRSTIAAEALSLEEGIEEAIFLRHMIWNLISMPTESLPIIAIVDNKSVVEAVHSTKMVDDKRLRLNIGAIKQALVEKEVSRLVWCPGNLQLANVMTKRGTTGYQLMEILQSGCIQMDQWY